MRTLIGLILVLVILTGCTVQPSATVATASPTYSTATPSPSMVAASPSPATALPSSTPVAGVLPAIEHVAWAGAQVEGSDDDTIWHVSAGLLNHQPTIRVDVTQPAAYRWLVVAGDVVAILSAGTRSTHVDIRHATDGSTLGSIEVEGSTAGPIAIDPGRHLLYVAVVRSAGGVAIHRMAFDGSGDQVLVTLDGRFTAQPIPSDRYDLTVDPDGVVIVEACDRIDGCLLWAVPPGAPEARTPLRLPGHPPVVCSIVGATRDWLIVQDDDACTADTGDAALPVRAIRRADGSSHIVTDDHVAIGRVLEIEGRTVLVGADGLVAFAAVDIATYDVESKVKQVVLRQVPPTASGQTVTVSSATLPAPWVLLEPWFVPGEALPELPGRLLDLSSGDLIELPIGTSGWS